MGYFANAGMILVEVLFGLLIGLFVFRVLLQLVRANFYNPICQFFYRATNPLLMPLRRFLPPWRSLDTAGALVSWLLATLKVWVQAALAGYLLGPLPTLILGLADLLSLLLNLFFWLILIRVILSFIRSDSYHPAVPLLMQLTEPVLAPFRRLIPATGPFDWSPLLAALSLQLAQVLLLAPLHDLGAMLARS